MLQSDHHGAPILRLKVRTVMPEASRPALSVANLFAERDARYRAEREAAEQLQRKKKS